MDKREAAYGATNTRQFEFMQKMIQLVSTAFQMGYMVSGGDLFRDARCPYGSKSSRHRSRLAIDLNLFKDGKYLQNTEDHRRLGEWWESQGGIWGGRFKDGNHYEAPLPGQPWVPHRDGVMLSNKTDSRGGYE